MDTFKKKHEQEVQILNLQQSIADTKNLTAIANLQTARINFQSEMIKHLDEAEANKWVQELHEDNQRAKEEREKEEAKTNEIWKHINERLNNKSSQEKSSNNEKSIDISDQQSPEKTENIEQPANKK